jgi:hypothetical protein
MSNDWAADEGEGQAVPFGNRATAQPVCGLRWDLRPAAISRFNDQPRDLRSPGPTCSVMTLSPYLPGRRALSRKMASVSE